METLLITAAAVWGVGTGLLIPRAAYRLALPPGEPWRTTCPAGHPLAGIGHGWLGRASCACGNGHGPSTPVTAAAAAAICAALAAATGARPELMVWLLLVPAGVLLAAVDVAVHRLPDVLTLPLAVATPVPLGGAALLPGAGGSWTHALLGALALTACCVMLFLTHPRGLGFGDVKLAPALGAVLGWYGWDILIVGTFAGFLLSALYGIGLLLTRRAGRTTAVPFGPFSLAGALLGVLLGTCIR
ncbi:prepilin peptidase [Streptomyces echinoruber]|uniref:prepilin peptidase n=1 Tax=Streptomyces echinoruber TaxID=68898 RepID=UPI00167C777A|nr:A24 family peptidase [Streptomyces echinoruber]